MLTDEQVTRWSTASWRGSCPLILVRTTASVLKSRGRKRAAPVYAREPVGTNLLTFTQPQSDGTAHDRRDAVKFRTHTMETCRLY